LAGEIPVYKSDGQYFFSFYASCGKYSLTYSYLFKYLRSCFN